MILLLKGGMGHLSLIDVDKSTLYIKTLPPVKNFSDFTIFDQKYV